MAAITSNGQKRQIFIVVSLVRKKIREKGRRGKKKIHEDG